MYFISFLPSGIRLWNALPPETKDAHSLSSFQYQISKKLKKKDKKKMKILYGWKKFGQIKHTLFRTSSSSLEYHLFSNNILNAPSCRNYKIILTWMSNICICQIRTEILGKVSKSVDQVWKDLWYFPLEFAQFSKPVYSYPSMCLHRRLVLEWSSMLFTKDTGNNQNKRL